MTRKRWARKAAGAMLVPFLLLIAAGCSYTATPADLLLSPGDTPDNAKLASAVREALPVRAKLALPEERSSTTAVNKADIDGDGKMEAIVTYVNGSDTNQVMVLRDDGMGWKPWFTFGESSSYGIDLLKTADLDRDGQPEVMIGWNQYGEPRHNLNLYHIDRNFSGDNPPTPFAELPYDTLGIGDADGDGRSELAMIDLDREEMKASVHILRIAGEEATEAASAPVNGAVNGYYHIEVGKIAKDRYGLLADAGVGAHSSSTVMLAWQDGKLSKIYPQPKPNGEVTENNSRQIYGGDGDGDGVLDINITVEAPGQSPGLAYSQLLWLERYLQWDGAKRFEVVQERYVDSEEGYELRFPREWTDRYTVRQMTDEDEVDTTGISKLAVDYYNEAGGQRAELFAIEAVPLDDWDGEDKKLQGGADNHVVLNKSGGFVYTAVWPSAPDNLPKADLTAFNRLQPDENRLRQMFKLLPQP